MPDGWDLKYARHKGAIPLLLLYSARFVWLSVIYFSFAFFTDETRDRKR